MPKRAPTSKLNPAQINNFNAARLIGDSLSSSFGPFGMTKLAVNSFGDIFIVDDGKSILEKMDYKHPVAKMMMDVASTLRGEVGDGAISAVILGSKLLEHARQLLELGIHPSTIQRGYERSLSRCLEIMEAQARKFRSDEDEELKRIARTALAPKIQVEDSEILAEALVRAMRSVIEEGDEVASAPDYIKVIAREGLSADENMIIDGVAFDATVLSRAMPKSVRNAKIAILHELVGIKAMKLKTWVNISDPESLPLFRRRERAIIMEMIDRIKAAHPGVLFTHKGIDDIAIAPLSDAGIFTVRRVPLRDIEMLERSTGAKMVLSPEELKDDMLGYATIVDERLMGDRRWIVVEGGRRAKAVTILLRRGVQRSADAYEDLLKRVLVMMRRCVMEPLVVTGGGACEMELASRLRRSSRGMGGKERLAAEKYAEALEMIPLTLAKNSGMNPLDAMIMLRRGHSSGKKHLGLDAYGRRILDMRRLGVIEPLTLKRQVLKSATEAAISAIKVGDVYAMSRIRSDWAPPKEPDYP